MRQQAKTAEEDAQVQDGPADFPGHSSIDCVLGTTDVSHVCLLVSNHPVLEVSRLDPMPQISPDKRFRFSRLNHLKPDFGYLWFGSSCQLHV